MPGLPRPLNPKAVTEAEERIHASHQNDSRPNALFDAEGKWLKLDPTALAQAGLREEWRELYSRALPPVTSPTARGRRRAPPPPQPHASRNVGDPVQSCPLKHWIEVQLVRLPDQGPRPDWWPKAKDDGGPYPYEPFIAWITDDPDYPKVGALSSAGSVRYDPIPAGLCSIEFALFWAQAMQALMPADSGAVVGTGQPKHWISVQLSKLPDQAERPDWWPKDDGGPYPGEPFTARITDDPNRLKEDELNSEGSVRYGPIPAGLCSIKFALFWAQAEKALKPADSGAVVGTGKPKHWISVQLSKLPDQAERPDWWPKDEGGPYSDEPFTARITDDPDRLKEDELNSEGSVRYDSIPAGLCSIKFALFWAQAEKALKPADSGAVAGTGQPKHWIKVQLSKMPDQSERPDWWPKDEGGPYQFEPFTAMIAGGRREEAPLDDTGETRRYEAACEGACSFKFPAFYGPVEEALKPKN